MRAIAIAALLSTVAIPAIAADQVVCMPDETPLTWGVKTGERVAATMEMTTGAATSTTVALMVGDDGHWTLLFQGPNDYTCIMAIGTKAFVVVPTQIER